MLPTIGKRRVRRAWKKCLAGAVESWKPTGLTFTTEVRDLPPYLGTIPDPPLHGYCQIVRNECGVGHPEYQRTWESSTYGNPGDGYVGFAIIVAYFYQPYVLSLGMTRNLAHEIGHALGLGHRTRESGSMDPHTLMGAGLVAPDAHDIDSVRDYYSGGVP